MLQGRVTCVALLCLLLGATASQAEPLNLPKLLPDIFSGWIDVSYSSLSGAFTASGTSMTYNPDGTQQDLDVWDNFSLTAQINNLGHLTSGSLTITGALSGEPFGTLLTANLIGFGFTPDSYIHPGSSGVPIFNFLGLVTGGTLESAFGGHNALVGTNLGAESAPTFDGDFHGSYTTVGDPWYAGAFTADTFATVPLPSSALFCVVSGLIVAAQRRWIRRVPR